MNISDGRLVLIFLRRSLCMCTRTLSHIHIPIPVTNHLTGLHLLFLFFFPSMVHIVVLHITKGVDRKAGERAASADAVIA